MNRNRLRLWTLCCGSLVSLAFLVPSVSAQNPGEFSPEAVTFFESQVWPILQGKCIACHSEKDRMSGLSLENRKAILSGGNRGLTAVPGHPEQSRLVEAVSYQADLKMPPGERLTDSEIAAISRWIALGMPWRTTASSETTRGTNKDHWAFKPVKRYPEPEIRNLKWAHNPIDRFILAKLEHEGISPSPEADKLTLIRRLTLDLIGLLPTPVEIDNFISDTRPDAYERLVERLLASPHFGERWGRHWLDIARYADSNGYNIDGAREIWMYRDWVINALNRDLPFDQFVIQQIGGDLLPGASQDQIIATGFHRNTLLNLEGGIDFEQYRVEAVVDRVETTGAAFLGLTLGCARCHDHKYDPISQREFYQFYAFFNNVDELSGALGEEGRKRAHEPTLEFGTPEQLAKREAIRLQISLLERELTEYEIRWEKDLDPQMRSKLEPDVREVLAVAREERNEFQRGGLKIALRKLDPGYQARDEGIAALRKLDPKIPSTMVMRELPTPRKAYIHLGGDFLRHGVEVDSDVPAVLPALSAGKSPNRLDLARWLVDPRNPLTSRVTVNRMWQKYFGSGLVETESDFGTQGSPPSHPELLDWLASEFMARGWSLKSMHRLMVTSATYRQASRGRGDLTARDPNNRFLARQQRLRLDAEIVRDAALSASGLLTSKIGGPSVFPPQPEGASKLGQIQRDWVADSGPDRYRRGMYTFFWRASPHPGLMVFDASDSTRTCTQRMRSNTPLQALTVLNDKAFTEFARGLAVRILNQGPAGHTELLRYGFRLCLARSPSTAEQARLETFLSTQLEDFRANPREALMIASKEQAEDFGAPEVAAWTATARVLLNLDEFITRE